MNGYHFRSLLWLLDPCIFWCCYSFRKLCLCFLLMCLIWLVSYFEVPSNMASVFNTFLTPSCLLYPPLPPHFFSVSFDLLTPCHNIIPNYYLQDAVLLNLFISTDAGHVSRSSSAHHQEHITVHTASGIVNQYCCLLLSWMRWKLHLIHTSS